MGDAAPPLAIQRWAKGDPVASFQPGAVYILDFWAVWCGPCLAIMPDLSDIQERHPTQVVAIGVTNPDDDNTDEAIDKTITQAIKLVLDMESRPHATEWESFLLEGEARRNAAVRIITADIRAAQGRKDEAAALLRPAIEAWTDNERMVPNKAELKRRLAEYELR